MTQITKEYATALFSLALEEKCTQEVTDALAVIMDVFRENSELTELLSSPAIPIAERIRVIDSAFSSLHEYAVSFVKLLCERGSVHSIYDIVAEYNELFKAFSRMSSATITTAVALTEEERKALKVKLEKMCAHAVVLEERVDTALIGGMIIEVDGKVIDASLRQRLGDVKDVISK